MIMKFGCNCDDSSCKISLEIYRHEYMRGIGVFIKDLQIGDSASIIISKEQALQAGRFLLELAK